MDRKKLSLIAAICGGAAFIAGLMPWLVSSAGPLGSRSFNAFDVNLGVMVVLPGLVAGAAALLVFLGKEALVPLGTKQLFMGAAGLFALGALFGIIRFFSGDYQSETVHGFTVGNSRGIGLFIALLAVIAGAAASWLAAQDKGGD